MPRRNAVVSHDTAFLDLMVDLEGHDLHPFKETKTACQGVRDLRPDVIILDVRMGNDVNDLLALHDKIQGAPTCRVNTGKRDRAVPLPRVLAPLAVMVVTVLSAPP
jgi:DNA-binding NtrC family response regulator